MKALPPTCDSQPCALIKRGGATLGKRPFTRIAYLVDTIAPDGQAIAVTSYIMSDDFTGGTKHPRRIEWTDISQQWSRQPTPDATRRAKRRLPITSTQYDQIE